MSVDLHRASSSDDFLHKLRRFAPVFCSVCRVGSDTAPVSMDSNFGVDVDQGTRDAWRERFGQTVAESLPQTGRILLAVSTFEDSEGDVIVVGHVASCGGSLYTADGDSAAGGGVADSSSGSGGGGGGSGSSSGAAGPGVSRAGAAAAARACGGPSAPSQRGRAGAQTTLAVPGPLAWVSAPRHVASATAVIWYLRGYLEPLWFDAMTGLYARFVADLSYEAVTKECPHWWSGPCAVGFVRVAARVAGLREEFYKRALHDIEAEYKKLVGPWAPAAERGWHESVLASGAGLRVMGGLRRELIGELQAEVEWLGEVPVTFEPSRWEIRGDKELSRMAIPDKMKMFEGVRPQVGFVHHEALTVQALYSADLRMPCAWRPDNVLRLHGIVSKRGGDRFLYRAHGEVWALDMGRRREG